MLKQGRAEFDPQVATIDPDRCTWCGICVKACPYDAISQLDLLGRQARGDDCRRFFEN